MWFSTSRLAPDCLAQMLQRGKFDKRRFLEPFGRRRKVVKQFQPQYLITSNLIIFWACGKMWLFQWSFMMKIFPLLFQQILQEEEVRREEGKGKGKLLQLPTLWKELQSLFNSLYLPHIYYHVKLMITFFKKSFYSINLGKLIVTFSKVFNFLKLFTDKVFFFNRKVLILDHR